ncbi:hypothetical protein OROGR_020683 [Orobanche gracilis]
MSTDGPVISSDSEPSSAPGSPKSRVKFMCSHGGKILPRPSDGHLKYVGGETRVISVSKDIHFQELMKKLTYLIDGEMTLKYQVASEDLDALVSVKSDEDVHHMFDEIDRYEKSGGPRLRAFLFPMNPVVVGNQVGPIDSRALEHRYIDAVNGVIHLTPNPVKLHPTINAMQHSSRVSSACSSPRSPDSCNIDAITNSETMTQNNYYNARTNNNNMHRVRSSPSICSLNVPQQSTTHHYIHQFSPQYVHCPNYQSPKPPVDSQKSMTPERLISVRSVGRADGVRYQLDPLPHHYSTTCRQSRGNGFVQYDECGHFFDRRMTDRNGSLVTSPVSASPLGQGGKAWDTTMRGDV